MGASRIPESIQDPLAFKVTLDNGRVRVEPEAGPLPKKKRNKPLLEKAGSVTIPIYKTRWTQKRTRRTYTTHIIVWKDLTGEHREKHSNLETARRRAQQIAKDIANGEISMVNFSQDDRAKYKLICDTARATGLSPEILVAKFAEMHSRCLPGLTVEQLFDIGLRNAPAGVIHKTCPDIYKELIPAREKDGASRNTVDDLRSRLKKFVGHFTGPLSSVTAKEINEWLRKLPVSRRTRNNYRGNIVDLYRFARSQGYISKNWAVLEDVVRVKNEPVVIEIFTPEEMTAVLAARRAIEDRGKTPNTLIPYLAIGAFGGVRHEEMSAAEGLPVLDWRQVNFETKEIRVLPEVARKIGHDRILPMQPNLVAWLEPYAKPNGPICRVANVSNLFARIAEEAGIKWKDNGLRKSFISYRLAITENIGKVAQEAGTSPDRINHNYKATIPAREAQRWFNIWPTTAEILQTRFAGFG